MGIELWQLSGASLKSYEMIPEQIAETQELETLLLTRLLHPFMWKTIFIPLRGCWNLGWVLEANGGFLKTAITL